MENKTSRYFCFTLNWPDEFELEHFPLDGPGPLEADLEQIPNIKYCCYQFELGANEEETQFNAHFQGYIELTKAARFSSIKKGQLQWAHCETRQGTRDQARNYCRKPEGRLDGPWEFGTLSGGQGQRNDLQEAAKCLLETRNLKQLAMEHPTSFIKYHSGFRNLLDATREAPVMPEPEQWRDWQNNALQLLQGPPDPRAIHWFVDFEGGAGKSFLVRYLATNRGALPLGSGRHDRLLHAYNGESCVTFDFSRDVGGTAGDTGGDRTPYAVIESIKNGVIFSGFFGAGPKIFPVPHVLCFSNFEPDRAKLSADRWDVHYVQK